MYAKLNINRDCIRPPLTYANVWLRMKSDDNSIDDRNLRLDLMVTVCRKKKKDETIDIFISLCSFRLLNN